MPIHFVTGLPRHGKTLWTLVHVKERAEKEGRQVYTCNIPGVSIDGWKTIEHPDEWLQLPDGAIIIVDELQDFWGANSPGAKVPEPILELSKHGKRGFDFYFITQDPTLVHNTPRKLCERHTYVVRAFGMHKAMVYQWQKMRTNPEKCTKETGVEKYPWSYPEKAFTWYKSADVHNIKRKIPLKVYAIPFLVVFAAAMVYVSFRIITGFGDGVPGNLAAADKAMGSGPALPGIGGSSTVLPPQRRQAQPMTPQEYVANYTARIPDLPHTAPAYDELTKPKQAPYPAACVSSSTRCNCYTQQATPLQISDRLCRDIVKSGFYVAWLDPQTGQQRVAASNQVNQVQAPTPAPAVIQPGTVALRF